MNPTYFGDSYDIVKRFFCAELVALGYSVVVDPMFTGEWNGAEAKFFHFIGAGLHDAQSSISGRTALLLDPDTGVRSTISRYHISFQQLASAAANHTLVFSFDQSFSRQHSPGEVMREKLVALQQLGCHGMYYDSHARFLFAAVAQRPILELREHLVSLGMPASRLVANAA